MISRTALFLLVLGRASFSGCGSSEPVAVDTVVEQRPVPHPSPAVPVETRTDTVSTTRQNAQRVTAAAGRGGQLWRYSLQVGAFRSPRHASSQQNRLRGRFSYSVLNEFNKDLGVYRIRIGVFESILEAARFRRTLWKTFPNEFPDSWIVRQSNEGQ